METDVSSCSTLRGQSEHVEFLRTKVSFLSASSLFLWTSSDGKASQWSGSILKCRWSSCCSKIVADSEGHTCCSLSTVKWQSCLNVFGLSGYCAQSLACTISLSIQEACSRCWHDDLNRSCQVTCCCNQSRSSGLPLETLPYWIGSLPILFIWLRQCLSSNKVGEVEIEMSNWKTIATCCISYRT